MTNMAVATLAVIISNRDFFPDLLVTEARKELLELLKEMDIEAVVLDEPATKLGGVETHRDAVRCADLFHTHSRRIDGVLVSLPNFGDERGVADALRLSRLEVPVLVHAYPDDLQNLHVERRRDAFCGKISVCNNLRQYGIPYSLTEKHVVSPQDASFKADLLKFVRVCRVVKGVRSARLGAIGARPTAFNTVRYSEKLLEDAGISVVTVDLSEIIGLAQKLEDKDPRVQTKLAEIHSYAQTGDAPPPSLVLMAKLSVIISDWMAENQIDATAIQCWTSIQKNYGVNSCTVMSMMSDKMMPSACEVDVTGVLTMYAMQLASDSPSALVDWNNNYGGDLNKCVFFHCGNWAKSFVPQVKISTAPILGTVVGEENTFGALEGRTPAGPLTYGRVSSDDVYGILRAYVGEGRFTDDELRTFGTRAVVEVPKLQSLMRYICRHGFEHHAAMNKSHTAAVLAEAFETYLGWEVYYHERPEDGE
jgi:L-fucose isomerase-like protein